jgi:thiol-disulfide isomerase/thioredoxin
VHILPYLDGNATGGGTAAELYKEFHLDEPWDSAHNRKLIPRMPAVFRNPTSASSKGSGFTNYLAVVGPDCVFDGSAKGIKFSQVPDGLSYTIMVVEADESVEWTKPDDLKFNPAAPKAGLGRTRLDSWIAALADGSIQLIEWDEPDEKVRDLFTCGRKSDLLELPTSDKASASSRPLSEAVEEFNVRAQADDIGRHQLVLTEEEVLSAIANFDWHAARVEPSIREIFEKVSETRTLPHDANLDFTSRYSDGMNEFDVWWIGLSAMTGPNTGYALPVRGERAEFKLPASKKSKSKFPSPEEQKWADIAWQRLGIELAPLPKDYFKKQEKTLLEYVRENGYDGGVQVALLGEPRMEQQELQQFDILVGLHAWPITSMEDVGKVLSRHDLAESNPIKFYALRVAKHSEDGSKLEFSKVIGRIFVNLDDVPQYASAPMPQPAPNYPTYAPPVLQPTQGLPVPTIPNAVEPVSRIPTAQAPMTQIVVDPREIALDPNLQGPRPDRWFPAPALAASAPDLLTESEKQQMKAAGGVRIEFFFHPDSEPCTKAAKLVPQYEKEFAGLVKVERINVAENPAAAKEADVDRVPTFKLYLGERPVLDRTGEMTVEQLDSTLASIARHEAYEPQVSMVKPQPELRYAGKTFDEWRTIWQTELSLERRLEVVKALAAFGASGRGKEAAQAILDVANQLDWTSVDFNTPSGKLKQGCIDAFTTGQSTEGYRIPVNDWWPLVVPIYENSPEKSTIVTYLSYQLPADEKELIPKLLALSQKGEGTRKLALEGLRAIDPQLKDDRVVLRLRDMLKNPHDSPEALRGAIINLLCYPHGNTGGGMYGGGGMGGAQGPVLRWVPELQEMLFHPDLEVRQTARFAIAHIQKKDAVPLVEYLIHIIDTQGSGRQRREAIRALGALGPQAAPAEDKLTAISHDRNDSTRFMAAAALLRIRPDAQGLSQDQLAKKLLGAASGETLDWDGLGRKIDNERQEILGVYSQAPGGGGGVY